MDLLTVKQVAERLQVSEATVYQLCAKQKLAHARIGVGRGAIRIDEDALAAFIQASTVACGAPPAGKVPQLRADLLKREPGAKAPSKGRRPKFVFLPPPA
jgi:excisionase family DNA binding protein